MRSWRIKRRGTSAEGGRKKHASSTCFLQAAYRASRYSYFTLALRACFSVLCPFIYPFSRCCTKHQRLSVLLCMCGRKQINLHCFVYIISNYRANKRRKKREIARNKSLSPRPCFHWFTDWLFSRIPFYYHMHSKFPLLFSSLMFCMERKASKFFLGSVDIVG